MTLVVECEPCVKLRHFVQSKFAFGVVGTAVEGSVSSLTLNNTTTATRTDALLYAAFGVLFALFDVLQVLLL